MIIGAAMTSGVVVINMGVLLVACTIKQRRRKGTCATESSGINGSLKCIHKKDKSSALQEEDTDEAAVYARPNKSRRTIVEEVNAVYDTTYENKTKEMSHVIHDYDVLNEGREIKPDTDMDKLERTAAEEASAVYDTTNDDRNKTIFNVNKDYDILSINREKIPNTEDKTNPGFVDEANTVYDTTYHKKFKQIFNVNNDHYGAISADIEQTPNTDY
ncbi:uncharacterized protein LOC123542867 [Mercenaria mercenaria]|uniref:uncharacterized protein LOC123542867 n=1 Tax=Mercenaria mercenaria TaxID=6596 RepID=UPI001E1DB173|nr:uncharacterized protein LOC123542867 [Mercenaria mercenaria]